MRISDWSFRRVLFRSPEAKLAREAELPYALVAMVTDYDCWRQEEAGVEIADVLKVLHNNADRAQRLVLEFAARLPKRRTPSPIETCLDEALITLPAARASAAVPSLDPVAGRLLTHKGGDEALGTSEIGN